MSHVNRVCAAGEEHPEDVRMVALILVDISGLRLKIEILRP